MSRYRAACVLAALLIGVAALSQQDDADSPLRYATFFGGSGADWVNGVTTDRDGNIYIAGTTYSLDLPTRNAIQQAHSEKRVLVSDDGGATWTPLLNPPGALLAIDPLDPFILFAADLNNISKSTNGGQSWRATQVTLPPDEKGFQPSLQIASIVVDPRNPEKLYASRTSGGILRSADGGESWAPANTGLSDVRGISVATLDVDPLVPNRVFASVLGTGLYRSTEGGDTWSLTDLRLPPGKQVISLAFHPSRAGTIYATTSDGTFWSTDGGQTWLPKGPRQPQFYAWNIAVDPRNPNTLYAGTHRGFQRSTDGGDTWEILNFEGEQVSRLVMNPARPDVFLAWIYPKGVLRSTDGGLNWERTGLPRHHSGRDFFFVAGQPDRIYTPTPILSDIFIAKFSPGGQELLFATYLGGNSSDSARSIAVDAVGNIFVGGHTQSTNFPTTEGAPQRELAGEVDVFVAKLSSQGALLYSTLLGSEGPDYLFALAVDEQGNAHIAGLTYSSRFPTTPGALQPQIGGSLGSDAFVAKLGSAGELLYSTFLGGRSRDEANAVIVDQEGNAVVAGLTDSSDFPVTANALQQRYGGSNDGFLVKISPDGGRLLYGSYVGGTEADAVHALATDREGNLYAAGATGSPQFPTTAEAFQKTLRSTTCTYSLGCAPGCIGPSVSSMSRSDVFVMKLDPQQSGLRYSTLLGGDCWAGPTSLRVDDLGNAYVALTTLSKQFPLRQPFFTTSICGQYPALVSKISASGAELLLSSYIDACGDPSLALGPDGSLFVAGSAGRGARITPGAFQPDPTVDGDGYLARIDPTRPAAMSLNRVGSAFKLGSGVISPGEIVGLLGEDIGPEEEIDFGLNSSRPLETEVGGTRVWFNGIPAPILITARRRVVCVAPYALSEVPRAAVQVEYRGKRSNVVSVRVSTTSPGLLTVSFPEFGFLANVRNEDGRLNGSSDPARIGSAVTLFATGLGVTDPPSIEGTVAGPSSGKPKARVTVRIGGVLAEVLDVSPLPGFVTGLFQIRARIPERLFVSGAAISVQLSTDQASPADATMFLR